MAQPTGTGSRGQTLQNAHDFHFKLNRQVGERVIEVDLHRLVADFQDVPGQGLAVGHGELDELVDFERSIVRQVAARDLTGPFAHLDPGPPAFDVRVHRLYNPEGITQYNIVPGLLGVILTMTMVMMTGLAITRERERGTMENLLAMPLSPLEVMTGKIVPYVAIGLVQASIIVAAARYVFGVPFVGSLTALYLSALLFIAANLTVGITVSSLAANQLQAMQLTFFYFLPNILLSGFMFPFAGMPAWAQWIGEALPLTHYLRIVRAIMLKGATLQNLQYDALALGVLMLAAMVIAVTRFRRTLD